jgi:hypothetical protein
MRRFQRDKFINKKSRSIKNEILKILKTQQCFFPLGRLKMGFFI